jgi:hypothetical protein
MDYPNTGALWTSKNRRNEKAPDMNGNIEIEKDLLLSMIEEAAGQTSVKIKLDGWRKKDKDGNPMVSMKVNTYKKPAESFSGKDPWDD